MYMPIITRKTKKSRTAAFLTALAMILSLITFFEPIDLGKIDASAFENDVIDSITFTLKVGDVVIADNSGTYPDRISSVSNKDQLRLQFMCHLVQDVSSEYHQIRFHATGFVLDNRGSADNPVSLYNDDTHALIGYWYVYDNTFYFITTSDFNLENEKWISAGLNGHIDYDAGDAYNPDEGKVRVKEDGVTDIDIKLTAEPEERVAELGINKSASGTLYSKNGKYYQDYTVTLTASGDSDVTDICMTDYLGTGAEPSYSGSVSLVSSNYGANSTYQGTASVSSVNSLNGFTMVPGEVITLAYTVEYSTSDLFDSKGDPIWNSASAAYNNVSARYDDVNSDDPNDTKTVYSTNVRIGDDWGDSQISKKGSYNESENKIYWTVTVKSKNFTGVRSDDINYLSDVSDTLYYNNKNVTAGTGAASVNAGAIIEKGSYDKDYSGTGYYTYVYSTDVDSETVTTSAKTYRNEISGTVNGRPRTASDTVSVDGINPLTKSGALDTATGEITWTVNYTVPAGGISTLKFTDTPSGDTHTYVDGSMRVTVGGAVISDYSISGSDVTVGSSVVSSAAAGTVIALEYKTKASPSVNRKYSYTNTVSAAYTESSGDVVRKSADDTVIWSYTKGVTEAITKEAYTDSDKNTAKWNLSIDTTDFLDRLEPGSVITISDNAEVKSRTVAGGDYTKSTGVKFVFEKFVKLSVGNRWYSEGFNDYLHPDAEAFVGTVLNENNGTITVTVTEDLLKALKREQSDKVIYISYSTVPDDYAAYYSVGKNFNNTYQVGGVAVVNNASGTFGGEPIGSDDAFCINPNYNNGGILDKKVKYDGGSVASYTVSVNKDKVKIGSGSTYVMVDKLGSNLEAVITSMKINGQSGEYVYNFLNNTDSASFSSGVTAVYEKDQNRIVLTFPNDSEEYTLTYDVVFRDSKGKDNKNTISYAINGDASNLSSDITGDSDISSEIEQSSVGGSTVSITLFKTDGADGSLLSGAVFMVEAGDIVGGKFVPKPESEQAGYRKDVTYTTSDKGEVLIEKLRSDTVYRLTEITAPEGYDKTDPRYFMIIPRNSQLKVISPAGIKIDEVDTKNYTVVNEKTDEGSINITVTKLWKDSSGAELKSLPASASVGAYDSESGSLVETAVLNDVNGWKYTFKVPAGKSYYVKEITDDSDAVNYTVSYSVGSAVSEDKSADISVSSSVTVTNTMNPSETGGLKITKIWKNAPNGADLPDVTFTLSGNGETYSDFVKSGNVYSISGVPVYTYSYDADGNLVKEPVEYTLSEKMSGTDYAKYLSDLSDENNKFTLVTSGSETVKTVNVTNTYSKDKTNIYISKEDAGGKELPGAALWLYSYTTVTGKTDDRVIALDDKGNELKWISGSSAKQLSLADGKYVLHEESRPTGYMFAQDLRFEVRGGKVLSADGTELGTNTLTMIDYKGGSVNIDKRNAAGELLSGAEITLNGVVERKTQDNGTVLYPDDYSDIKDVTTLPDGTKARILNTLNSTGNASYNLEDGTYTITELTAPDGYLTADPITFVIKNGTVTTINGKKNTGNNTIIMVDELSEGNVIVSKKTSLTSSSELTGAKLALYKNSKSDANKVLTWDTEKNPHVFEKLSDGKYILSELSAPKGYLPAEDIVFNIENGKVKEYEDNKIIMIDKTGDLIMISKQDVNGTDELEGAVLRLYKGNSESGELIEEWTSGGEPKGFALEDGLYTLSEESAPDGYIVAESKTFVVSGGKVVSGGSDDTVVMKDKPGAEVSISKVDINNSKEIKGAELEVYRIDGGTETLVDNWTSGDKDNSDSSGNPVPHKISLETGSYKLVEKTAPDGYIVAEEIEFNVSESGDGVSVSISKGGSGSVSGLRITMKDERGTEVTFKKLDGDEKVISGALIEIREYDEGSESAGRLVTSWETDGSVKKLSLTDGTYVMIEKKVPKDSDFVKAEDIVFSIENGRLVGKSVLDISYVDENNRSVIMIDETGVEFYVSKVDMADSEEIEGAVLEIRSQTGDVIDKWTSGSDGKDESGKLIPHRVVLADGRYQLVEVIAPDGYAEAETITFKVKSSADGTAVIDTDAEVSFYDEESIVLTMKDKKSGSSKDVKISKKKVNGTQELPGAKLSVYKGRITGQPDDQTEPVESWTSGTEEHEISLAEGTYTLVETTAPDGYSKTESIIFKVDEEGRITVESGDESSFGVSSDGGTLTMFDNSGAVFNVSKKAVNGTDELEGAVLEIRVLDEDGTNGRQIDKWTSGKTAHEISLDDGKYILIEKTAPNGYTVAESIEFEVNGSRNGEEKITLIGDNGETDSESGTVTLTMRDESGGDITIFKKDLNGDLIAGAKLELYAGRTAAGKPYKSWVSSSENGEVFTLFDGYYTLHEAEVPENSNYLRAYDITFRVENGLIKDGDSVSEVVMTDLKGGKVTVSKQDIAGNEIAGASLAVYEGEITSVEGKVSKHSWISGSDSERDGSGNIIGAVKPHELTLEDGVYTLVEITAPNGYLRAENITFEIIDGKVSSVGGKSADTDKIVMTDKQGVSVEIGKTDESGNPVVGASLVLYKDSKSDANVVRNGKWISDGSFREFDLENGNYILTELDSSAALADHEKSGDIGFEVKDGKIITDLSSNSDVYVISENKFAMINRNVNTVVISKQDVAGNEITGAVLKIEKVDEEGNVIEENKEWTWTSQAKISHSVALGDGTYTLTETTAPNGYEKAETITFKVKNGKVSIYNPETGKYEARLNSRIVMVDEFSKTKVLISKRNIAGDELAGAVLELHRNSASGELLEVWTSSGKAKEFEITAGTYVLRETAAPGKYKISTDITFDVEVENGNVKIKSASYEDGGSAQLIDEKHLVMIDQADGQILISKRDINGTDEVIGAELAVYRLGKDSGNGRTRTIVGKAWNSDGTAKQFTLIDGDYVLVENTAPDGYLKSEEIRFSVVGGSVSKMYSTDSDGNETTEDVEGNHIIMKDDFVEKQDVLISKKNVAGGEISGATLTLYSVADGVETVLESWISGASGEKEHKISVPEGVYRLVEKIAPEDYLKAEDILFSVDSKGSVTIKSGSGSGNNGRVEGNGKNVLVMVDKASTGKVLISKKDAADGHKEVKGAKLELYRSEKDGSGDEQLTLVKDSDGRDAKWTSDGSAKEFSLEDGDYVLKETGAPNGYLYAEDIRFTVSAGKVVGSDFSENNVVMFDFAEGTVEISKQNIAGDEIGGAVLIVTGRNGTDFSEEWTSVEGESHKMSLNDGDYVLKEVTAPDGYERAESISFTVEDGKVKEFSGNKVVMTDKLSEGSVVICKTDVSGNEIEGASLSLYKVKGSRKELVESWVSGRSSKLLSLEDGKYTLVETNAPDGYKYADSITFTVKNGKVKSSEDNKITMIDEAAVADTIISKQNIAGDEITGAVLTLYEGSTGSGKAAAKWTTGGKPKSLSLKDGTYTLVETGAANGYEYADSITFTIENGVVTGYDGNKVEMIDEAGPNTVIFSLKNPIGENLDDGGLILVKITDGGDEIIDKWITDGDSSKVIILDDGDYKLVEEKVPDDYNGSEDIRFTVKDGVVKEFDHNNVIMINDTSESTVLISKRDVGGNELPGAKLTLYKGTSRKGEVVATWTSSTSAKRLSLKDGTYTLVEVGAPNGYKYADSITFKVTDGKVGKRASNIVVMVDYAEDSEKPGDDTKKPEGNTNKPDDDTKKPEGNTSKPDDDTKKPEGNTNKPDDDTKKPEGNTNNPDGDTKKPEGNTNNPDGDTKKPDDNSNSGGDNPDKVIPTGGTPVVSATPENYPGTTVYPVVGVVVPTGTPDYYDDVSSGSGITEDSEVETANDIYLILLAAAALIGAGSALFTVIRRKRRASKK